MRTWTTVILAASALVLGGCGSSGSEAASRPTPPSPLVLSAYIGSGAVRVSPARIGAGPVLLTVTNQSARPVRLLVSRRGGGRPAVRTAPINPQGVTQLKLDFARGTYALAAAPGGRRSDAQRSLPSRISAVTLHVGRERASGGGQLMTP